MKHENGIQKMKCQIGHVVDGWIDPEQTVFYSPGQRRKRMVVCSVIRLKNRPNPLEGKVFNVRIIQNINIVIPAFYEIIIDGVGK
jgi:hypothetical protein